MSTVHRTALESDIRSAIMNKVIPDCCCVFCKVFAFLFAVKGMENGKNYLVTRVTKNNTHM